LLAIKAHRLTGSTSTKASLENEVIFEGDRLEVCTTMYWTISAIWLTDGSTNNSINHLTIKKCHHRIINSKQWWYHCIFKNTQIYANYGILAQTAKITAENIVINNRACNLSLQLWRKIPITHSTLTIIGTVLLK
jgi:hypothetical protein